MRRGPDAAANQGLSALVDASHADLDKAQSSRFPAPEVFECEQYASKVIASQALGTFGVPRAA